MRVRILAALSLVLSTTGCAAGVQQNAPRTAATDPPVTRIEIRNHNWSDIRVYMRAPRAAERRIAGPISTGSVYTFRYRERFHGGLTFRVEPIGAGRGRAGVVLGPVQAKAGDHLVLRIQNNWNLSSYTIRPREGY